MQFANVFVLVSAFLSLSVLAAPIASPEAVAIPYPVLSPGTSSHISSVERNTDSPQLKEHYLSSKTS